MPDDTTLRCYFNCYNPLALALYSQLLDLNPDSHYYLTLRANILLSIGLHDLAMRDYKRANKLAGEKQAWILANIGNLLKNQSLYRDGILFLQRALELEPESSYAHERLAQAIKLRDEEEKKFGELIKRAKAELTERIMKRVIGTAARPTE